MSIRMKSLAKITRFYPLYSGCGTIANSKYTKAISGTSAEDAWCPTHGGELLVPLNDWVGRAIYFTGDLDPKITWVMKRIVRPNDTVLDIGANLGIVTLIASKLTGAKGHVHSFEPNPNLCNRIISTINRNDIKNATLHSLALGTKSETLTLTVPKHNAGAASLLDRGAGADAETHSISVKKLDDVCRELNLKRIRLIKIDVEGFEHSALSGGRTTLQETRPDAILFELNNRTESNFEEEPLIALLRELDYEFFCIPRCLFRMNIKRLSECDPESFGHDFIASPKGSKFEEIAKLICSR